MAACTVISSSSALRMAGPTLRSLLRGGELMVLMLLLLIVHPRAAWSSRPARPSLHWPGPIWRIWAVLHMRREELRAFCPQRQIRTADMHLRGGPLA